jgi:hypothetical protein
MIRKNVNSISTKDSWRINCRCNGSNQRNVAVKSKNDREKKVFSRIPLLSKLFHSPTAILQKITTRTTTKIIETLHIASLY